MIKRRVIFLGNNIFLEDKIGLIVGSILKERLEEKGFEVEILERSGMSLFDIMSGAEEIVIVDSIAVDDCENVGRVFEVDLKNFAGAHVKTPHTLCLSDVIEILKMLNLNPPKNVYVIGIGIKDIQTLSEDLSDELKTKLPEICENTAIMIDLLSSK